jgi:hypothetical protein
VLSVLSVLSGLSGLSGLSDSVMGRMVFESVGGLSRLFVTPSVARATDCQE